VRAGTGAGLGHRFLRVGRTVAGKLGWYPATVIRSGEGQGLRISLRQASGDYTTGTNELPVQRAIVENLAPGGVFYDIGSNVGFFSLLAARRVGERGRVYAFEPVPLNARCIRANAARNDFENVEVVETAVGGAGGTQTLFVTAHPGGATLSARDRPPDVTGTIEVPVTTIDEFVDAGRGLPPTFVKIDVEGLELDVLRGMSQTLESVRPAILCEVDDTTLEGLSDKLEDVRGALEPHGYTCRQLESSYAHEAWHVAHVVALHSP
jgi:FkbM family methyltransferase